MSEQPKVYSIWGNKKFKDIFSQHETMNEKDVFIEEKIYHIQFYMKEFYEITSNILEDTVLKLMNIGITDTLEIADTICLDKEIIKAIKNTLKNKKYLSENTVVSDAGREYIENLDAKHTKEKSVDGQIFINIENKLSYFIYYPNYKNKNKKIQFENVKEYDKENSRIKISVGTSGESSDINGIIIKSEETEREEAMEEIKRELEQEKNNFKNEKHKKGKKKDKKKRQEKEQELKYREEQLEIQKDKDKFEKIELTQEELINNVYLYNSYANNSDRFKKINLSEEKSIVYKGKYQKILKHYKLVTLKGNSNLTIASDGFCICDDIVMNYIKNKYVNLSNSVIKGASKIKGNSKKHNKVIMDLNFDNTKYKEVYMILSDKPRDIGGSIEERKEDAMANNQRLVDYYGALEWCLYYYLKDKKLNEKSIVAYKNRTPKENAKKISKLATDIIGDKFKKKVNLFEITKEGIERFEGNNPPEMSTVLSLSILYASENENTTIHNILMNTEIIDFITKLKNLRNKRSHENKKSNKSKSLDVEALVVIYNKVSEIVNIILPDFDNEIIADYFEIKEIKETKEIKDDISEKNTNIETELLGRFNQLYDRFDRDTKELLHKVQDTESKNKNDYILVVSKLLESVLSIAIRKRKNNSCTGIKENILNIIKIKIGDCPDNLRSVKEDNIYRALKGDTTTLGGYVLAFAFTFFDFMETVNSDDLKKIIYICSNVIELRGHGNNVNISLSDEETEILKEQVFDVIKIIGGI